MKKAPEIKILSDGFNRFQTQCTKCGCEYEYDIKNVDFGKKKRGYGLIKCPVCGYWSDHRLNENVRKVDVLVKYKDEIKQELVPEIAKDIIGRIGWCIRERNFFYEGNRVFEEDDFDYEMIAKWWEKMSPVLSERYERRNPYMNF